MLRLEKKTFIMELEKIFQFSNSIVIIHYHGLTVAELTHLRTLLKSSGANLKVVKNTLSKIAISNANIKHSSTMFSGPTAIAYSEDPITAIKIVVDFARSSETLKIIGGVVNENILSVDSIQELARLPSLDELRNKIFATLQATVSNVVRVTRTPADNILRVMQAYAEKSNSK